MLGLKPLTFRFPIAGSQALSWQTLHSKASLWMVFHHSASALRSTHLFSLCPTGITGINSVLDAGLGPEIQHVPNKGSPCLPGAKVKKTAITDV